MQEYRVTITETFKKHVYVAAEDEIEAIEKVSMMYSDGKIIPSEYYDKFDYEMEAHNA